MRRRTLLLAAPALLSSRAGAVSGWPRVVEDGLGRRVTITREPRRIVAIFASNTEMLAAIGGAERIVGIESFTRFPPEVVGRPLVGGRLGFSAEAISRLEPDLVIMTPARNAAHSLTEPMARIGVPTLVITHRDVPRIFANLRMLGLALGLEARSEALVASLEARLAAVTRRIAGRAPVRVFAETSSTGAGVYGTVRPGTYSFDAVRLAGGASVFPGLSPNGPSQVSGEAILRADPAFYLVAGRPDQTAEVARRTGFHTLSAVREGRVRMIGRAQFLIPGPRVLDGVESLSAMLHPVLA